MNDAQLIDHMKALLKREAALDLEMLDTLREIHRRKLYLAHGSPSFHAFCTKVLGMSDDSAWRRIHAAALADRFPDLVKPLIAERQVNLTGLSLLDKAVTADNAARLITEAVGKSNDQIRQMVARELPKPDCKAGVRKMPAKKPEPLSATTWKFQATMTAETHALLTEVRDLLNDDDCNTVLSKALKALRDELLVTRRKALKRSRTDAANSAAKPAARATQAGRVTPAAEPSAVPSSAASASNDTTSASSVRHPHNGGAQQAHGAAAPATSFAKTDAASVRHPHAGNASQADDAAASTTMTSITDAVSVRRPHDPTSPTVPRWMERQVRERDGHRCTFMGYGGRCSAMRDLQIHHVQARALGGLTELGNLTLHCGVHNRYQAEVDLGVAIANAWRG